MKILLIGEYSNVHNTLADGLRQLGHKVTVASNGDYWKNYPRDIDLARETRILGGAKLLTRLCSNLYRLKGYDVVQIVNPIFIDLKAERIFPIYKWLREHNGKMFMGAFGMDYYWVNENIQRKPLRYSDFNIGDTIRHTSDTEKERQDWLDTPKERLNKYIANDCDGIIACLYEYWACYAPLFPTKTSFAPLPIKPHETLLPKRRETGDPINIFVGISKSRNEYKGTDIMLAAAQAVSSKYPGKINLNVAEGVPFSQYVEMMNGSDVILDQLYSYTPAMNALEAMNRGIICVGGGEPESYDIIGERKLKPIINVTPSYESVFHEIERLVLNPNLLNRLKIESVEYVRQHHDYIKVAKQYESIYRKFL